jgi:hypothetical protein
VELRLNNLNPLTGVIPIINGGCVSAGLKKPGAEDKVEGLAGQDVDHVVIRPKITIT